MVDLDSMKAQLAKYILKRRLDGGEFLYVYRPRGQSVRVLFNVLFSQVAEQDGCPGCVGDLHHGEEEEDLEGQGECSQSSDSGQGRHAARTDRQQPGETGQLRGGQAGRDRHHRCWQGTSAGHGNPFISRSRDLSV